MKQIIVKTTVPTRYQLKLNASMHCIPHVTVPEDVDRSDFVIPEETRGVPEGQAKGHEVDGLAHPVQHAGDQGLDDAVLDRCPEFVLHLSVDGHLLCQRGHGADIVNAFHGFLRTGGQGQETVR